MIAETLTHYRIVEKIGEGGMGVVYRARDERLDRDVAIKVLPTGTLADDTARKRFRKEAQALAKLSHPNIGVIYDFDTQEGVDFLVMEYIAGTTLAERLGAGAVLYEMATGQRVFRETLATQLTDAILHQPPVSPRALNARVSPELEWIILKCLDKEPENRYQSARELAVDLRRLVSPSAVLPIAAPRRFAQYRGRYAIMAACLAV